MDAIELLTRDHREIEDLFDRIAVVDRDAERSELFEELSRALTVHSRIEEDHFYRAFREPEVAPLLHEFRVAHEEVRGHLWRLSLLEPSDEEFESRLEHLHKAVELHVADEERMLFPRIRQLSSEEMLRAIGEDMRATQAAHSAVDPREWIAPDDVLSPF